MPTVLVKSRRVHMQSMWIKISASPIMPQRTVGSTISFIETARKIFPSISAVNCEPVLYVPFPSHVNQIVSTHARLTILDGRSQLRNNNLQNASLSTQLNATLTSKHAIHSSCWHSTIQPRRVWMRSHRLGVGPTRSNFTLLPSAMLEEQLNNSFYKRYMYLSWSRQKGDPYIA